MRINGTQRSFVAGLSALLLVTLTACSSSLPLVNSNNRAAGVQRLSTSTTSAALKAPTSNLRIYKQAQQKALSTPTVSAQRVNRPGMVRAANAAGEADPNLTPVLDPAAAPQPEQPPTLVNPAQPDPLGNLPYTPPAAPILNLPMNGDAPAVAPGTAPGAVPGLTPGAPAGTNPADNFTAPSANEPGLPGGTAPVGGHFRYEDLQWHLRKVDAPRAWRTTQGNPELTVAVIDTGVDYQHPAFRNRILKGYDFADGDMDPSDEVAHGTHVAGIIAGNDGNVRGIAPNVRLLAIKVFSKQGFVQGEHVLARAIRYATQHGASIINLSLGSPTLMDCGPYSEMMRALNSAIDEAYSQGVTVVTAAGNESYDFIHGRCSVQQNVNQIPVIATSELDRLAAFSNYSNFTHPKAVSAPGVNIYSTIPRFLVCNATSCGMPYDYMDGTSMASPIIAGSLALIRSAMYTDYVKVMQRRLAQNRLQGPILSFREFFHERANVAQAQLSMAIPPAQLSERLLFSFTNVPSRVVPQGMIYEGRRDPIYGFGRIDIGASTEAAANVFSAAQL